MTAGGVEDTALHYKREISVVVKKTTSLARQKRFRTCVTFLRMSPLDVGSASKPIALLSYPLRRFTRSEAAHRPPSHPGKSGMPQDVVEHVQSIQTKTAHRRAPRQHNTYTPKHNSTRHKVIRSRSASTASCITVRRSLGQIRDFLSFENTTSNEVRVYIRLA